MARSYNTPNFAFQGHCIMLTTLNEMLYYSIFIVSNTKSFF